MRERLHWSLMTTKPHGRHVGLLETWGCVTLSGASSSDVLRNCLRRPFAELIVAILAENETGLDAIERVRAASRASAGRTVTAETSHGVCSRAGAENRCYTSLSPLKLARSSATAAVAPR